MAKGKPHAIDLLRLYSSYTAQDWSNYLTRCLNKQDLHELQKTLYGLQAGMDDLVKKKLNSPKICAWFIRMQRSVENTMRDIIRKKIPMALDNPANKDKFMDTIGEKRKRDQEIEKHLRKSSY